MTKMRFTFSIYFAIIFLALGLFSCHSNAPEGTLILTRAAAGQNKIFYSTSDSLRSDVIAQIVEINPGKRDKSPKVLTSDYYSARSPQISYDGKFMLFSGRLKQQDNWQIWEMDLNSLKTRQVTSSAENCVNPVYLPGGRIIFSTKISGDSLKAGYSIYTCNIDGSTIKRITFNPHTYTSSTVLSDGRIYTTGTQVYPVQGNPLIMVMRPDGTKSELFYKSPEHSRVTGAVQESAGGKLFFTEESTGNGVGKGSLICINYSRPLHSRADLSSGVNGDFFAVSPQKSGALLVTYRKSENERYSIYEFDPDSRSLGNEIYSEAEYDILEAVETGAHERPKKLPSEVDMGVKTGLIMCQDINITDHSSPSLAKALKVEVLGIDSVLGSFQVEEDGSFYMKVMADKPFRIRTFDNTGKITDDPCGWIWLRPNERRGCVGCHENPEIVPGNRIPVAVKKSPVTIPMHINKVVEKKVSLE